MKNHQQLSVRHAGAPNAFSLAPSPAAAALLATGAALATAAAVNASFAHRAEVAHPPLGRFVEVDGLPVHYVERGQGDPLVLLHGNVSMVEDFLVSGIIHDAAKRYRVIAFDRPGYGHTARPRGKIWTAAAQARLIVRALAILGVSKAIIYGHSRGAQVAAAMGIKYPSSVAGLVLASGYYFPTLRADILMAAPTAAPLLGEALSWTTAALFARVQWPAMVRKLFAPRRVAPKFDHFPAELALRPHQIRANAAEGVLTWADAFAMMGHYDRLSMPIAVVAGTEDQVINPEQQSLKLHRQLRGSMMRHVRGVGHMVHQSATDEVLGSIDLVAALARPASAGATMVPDSVAPRKANV